MISSIDYPSYPHIPTPHEYIFPFYLIATVWVYPFDMEMNGLDISLLTKFIFLDISFIFFYSSKTYYFFLSNESDSPFSFNVTVLFKWFFYGVYC